MVETYAKQGEYGRGHKPDQGKGEREQNDLPEIARKQKEKEDDNQNPVCKGELKVFELFDCFQFPLNVHLHVDLLDLSASNLDFAGSLDFLIGRLDIFLHVFSQLIGIQGFGADGGNEYGSLIDAA
ncbi:hypothetical protein ES705_25656 [subsurface metagenome]